MTTLVYSSVQEPTRHLLASMQSPHEVPDAEAAAATLPAVGALRQRDASEPQREATAAAGEGLVPRPVTADEGGRDGPRGHHAQRKVALRRSDHDPQSWFGQGLVHAKSSATHSQGEQAIPQRLVQ